MSEATTRAYAAAATALRDNFLAYAGDLLGLDPLDEAMIPTDDDPYGVTLLLRSGHGTVLTIPLITTSMKEWRRRGPGSPTEMFVRAIGRIATARIWRRHGTIAPPYGLLETNGLGKALVERAKMDPQGFFDATWTPDIHIGDKYSDTSDWRSRGEIPALLVRSPAAAHTRIADLPDMPWMSGHSGLGTVYIEAVSLDPRLALYWKPHVAGGFEIRLTPHLPRTMVEAALYRPLRDLITHPMLDRLPLEIDAVNRHQRSLRLTVRKGDLLWRRYRLKGGNVERRELKDELRAMTAGRRALERVIAGHLTLPGQRGDVQVPWDDILFDEDIDTFAEQPWPEPREGPFQGLISKRAREHLRHRDGDPLIRFEEDDPASYT